MGRRNTGTTVHFLHPLNATPGIATLTGPDNPLRKKQYAMKDLLRKLLYPPPIDLPPRERERLRRNRELTMAGGAFLLTLVLTWILLDLFDTGSALFVSVFILNFLLLLGVALVVIRNSLKLVLERRSGILGSRLRTRLTLACVGLTLAPCILMLFVSTKFVQLSMDFWFKDQIQTSMESALEVGRSDFERTGARLLAQSRSIYMDADKTLPGGWNAPVNELAAFLAEKRHAHGYSLIGYLSPGRLEKGWLSTPDSTSAWENARGSVNWEGLSGQGFQSLLESGATHDHVVSVFALAKGQDGYLVTAENMGVGYKAKLDRVASGASEYKQLWNMRRAVKWMLYVGLSTLTLLIIMGAIWFGIRVAKEVTAPMLMLAAATQRIARGDLSVRLEQHSSDEAGALMRSFNQMAEDLEASRNHLNGAFARLEEQNREIAQHSQYIETVLNTIDSAVISADEKNIVTMANKAACAMLLESPRALVGKPLAEILPGEQETLVASIRSQFRRRPRSHWQGQMKLVIEGQERRVILRAAGLTSLEGKSRGFVALLEDITETERVQRMEAWREVARRIAHEIKNPLTPIKLSAQRLQRKFGMEVEDPAFSQSTNLIVRQVEALQEMVQEFSHFAKLPEVNPIPDTVVPLLRELVEFFQGSHSRIHWDLATPESLPHIPMDREALRRAFMNLFSNAAEALEDIEGGCVEVQVALENERGLLRVDVLDNGPGLTKEEHSRLFEPYFSRKKSGTGLGLTIVKSIIADHKGYVRAAQNPDGGAILTVELPLS